LFGTRSNGFRIRIQFELARDQAALVFEGTMRLGVREVAAHLGVSESTVFHWVERDRLPATRIDGQFRFSPAAVYEWATARAFPITGDLFEERGGESATLALTEALQAGGVVTGLGGEDKQAVMAAAVERLHLPAHVNRGVILEMLLAREKLGSTGIGDGFAIPHVRDPIVLRVPQPQVTLYLLERQIEFGALDQRPVHTLFLAVTPTIKSHLLILSRLATVLHEEAVRTAILGRDPSRILSAIERAERVISVGGPGS
jgi:PTS system nitrogen regulatory IIA component